MTLKSQELGFKVKYKPRIRWDAKNKYWYTGVHYLKVTGSTPAMVMEKRAQREKDFRLSSLTAERSTKGADHDL